MTVANQENLSALDVRTSKVSKIELPKEETMEELYSCSLLDFTKKVEKFVLDLVYQKRTQPVPDGIAYMYGVVQAELYFLRNHKQKLLMTRDSNRNWIEDTFPLFQKVEAKIVKKAEKLVKYNREIPLPEIIK